MDNAFIPKHTPFGMCALGGAVLGVELVSIYRFQPVFGLGLAVNTYDAQLHHSLKSSIIHHSPKKSFSLQHQGAICLEKFWDFLSMRI